MNRNNAQAIAAPLVKNIIFVVATLSVLVLVAVQLGANFTLNETNRYTAAFTDTSGLKSGDTVRIAGVEVGTVHSVTVQNSKIGMVSFDVDSARALPKSVRPSIRFLNLTGDRYLELQQGQGSQDRLPPGAVIPITQTTPALDLDVLLQGFNPLFEGLAPDQINQLSGNLISVLQGEGGNLDGLFSHAASLSGTLATRDKQIGSVIDNLNVVLGTLDQRSPELGQTIERLQQLVSGLSQDRNRLGESFDSTNKLVTSVSDLLDKVRGPLKGTVDQIHRVAEQANKGEFAIDDALSTYPGAYLRVGRIGARGAGYNLFICALRVKLTGPDGKPFFTPWQGPNPNLKRCQSGNVYPLETPQQREASHGWDDVVGHRPPGQGPDGRLIDDKRPMAQTQQPEQPATDEGVLDGTLPGGLTGGLETPKEGGTR
ncbi:MCE family protein [Pseudonocardia spinosispora]|uniref:MCE family protein n=1 Tax=Pseudonocardia spinosispora TaxID=103441 RepID=UPI00040A31B9|nr:MCE family protein [Pseudonocardia spinosispora]